MNESMWDSTFTFAAFSTLVAFSMPACYTMTITFFEKQQEQRA